MNGQHRLSRCMNLWHPRRHPSPSRPSHSPSISFLNAVVGVSCVFTVPGSLGASVLPDAELGISVDDELLSVNEFFVSPPTVDAALTGVTVLLSLVPPAVVLLPRRRVAPDIIAAR